MNENRDLKERLMEMEMRLKEAEGKFSTPEEGPRGHKPKEDETPTAEEEGPRGRKPQEEESPKAKEEGPRGRKPKEAETPREGWYQSRGEYRSERRSRSRSEGAEERKNDFAEKSLQFMSLMMENMKEMQKRMVDSGGDSGMIRGVEIVRSNVPELPTLPAWSPTQGPLQLGDWMLTIAPIIADLSITSELWWERTVALAEQWYRDHMAMSPINRLAHGYDAPLELQQPSGKDWNDEFRR